MTGVFIGIGKGFTAAIERSSADVIVLPPGATALFSGPMGMPRRYIPLIYNHPEVVQVRPLAMSGGMFQNIRNIDPTMSAADRARQGAPRQRNVMVNVIDTAPGSVTIPVDYSDELVEALRQPFTVAVDESALPTLGVQLGDRAIYNGQTVTVVEAIAGGEGRVKVGDSVWSAVGADAEVGARVRVIASEGTVLRVERV